MEANKISAKLQWLKKPNYLTVGRAMSALNVDEPKLSSMSTLRVELKERKCEIRWFKFFDIRRILATGAFHWSGHQLKNFERQGMTYELLLEIFSMEKTE